MSGQSLLVLDPHRRGVKPIVHRRDCPLRADQPGRPSRVLVGELADAEAYGWDLCAVCKPEQRRLIPAPR